MNWSSAMRCTDVAVAMLAGFLICTIACDQAYTKTGIAREGEPIDFPDEEDVGEPQRDAATDVGVMEDDVPPVEPDVSAPREDVRLDQPEVDVCVPEVENNAAGNCCDGIDNDCDGLADWDDHDDCRVGGEDGYCAPTLGGCPSPTEWTDYFCSPDTCSCQPVPNPDAPLYPGPCRADVYVHSEVDPSIFVDYTYDLGLDTPRLVQEIWREPSLHATYPELFLGNLFIRRVDYGYLEDGRFDSGADVKLSLQFDEDDQPGMLFTERVWQLFYSSEAFPLGRPDLPVSFLEVTSFSSEAPIEVPEDESRREFYTYHDGDDAGGYLRTGRPQEHDLNPSVVRFTNYFDDDRVDSDVYCRFIYRRPYGWQCMPLVLLSYSYSTDHQLTQVDYYRGFPVEGEEVAFSAFEYDEHGNLRIEIREHSSFGGRITRIVYHYDCW